MSSGLPPFEDITFPKISPTANPADIATVVTIPVITIVDALTLFFIAHTLYTQTQKHVPTLTLPHKRVISPTLQKREFGCFYARFSVK